MMKKKWLFSLIILFALIALRESILGKILVVFITACVIISWGLCLILLIVSKVMFFKQYKFLKRAFEYLKIIHKKRYQSYFSDNKEIDDYSKKIDDLGQIILNLGSFWLTQRLPKRKRERLERIVAQTEEMLTKDFVAF